MRLLTFFFLGCLISPTLLFGQEDNYYLKKLTVQDGLPNNHIRWITQDKLGFLWISTWDGLARYDGSMFKVYRHNPNDTNSLSYFESVKTGVDSNNNLWIYTGYDLCRLQRNQDSFIVYGHDRFPPDITSGYSLQCNDILIDPLGQLIVSYGNEYCRYNPQSDKFEVITSMRGLIEKYNPSHLSFDEQGDYWFLQVKENGDYGKAFCGSYLDTRMLQLTDSFIIYQQRYKAPFSNETPHFQFHDHPDGNKWIVSSYGLYMMERDTFRLFDGHIPDGEFEGESPLCWSIPAGGLMIYYPDEDIQDTLLKRGKIETVSAYYVDDQQNIWFSDISNPPESAGLSLVYRAGNSFKHYLSGEGESSPYAIFGLAKDKEGNIWAGGRPNDHIVKIASDGTLTKIDVPFHPIHYFNVPRNIATDPDGNIWIAFFFDYLYSLYPNTLAFTDYSYINPSNERLRSIFRLITQLDDNHLITAGQSKIIIFDPVSGEMQSTSIPNKRELYSIYQDSENHLWIGSSGRLLKYSMDLDLIEINEISNKSYNIEEICPGDSSDLWLALLGGGIAQYNTRSQKVSFYTTFNGLAHNTVYSIMRDKAGNFWVSHNLGISMFNPYTRSFINFDDKDGLQIQEFNSEAAFVGNDGEMLFGGIGGIVSFYPESVKLSRKESCSDLVISEFRVSNNIIYLDQPLQDIETLKLPKGSDNCQLEFVRADFRYGDEMRYRYMLEGIQSEWTITDSKHRRVNFTSLMPGRYTFKVESTDIAGEWKYKTSLVIDIPSYFHQTFFMKLKQVRLNEHKKQEQLKLETLRGQMNPHFIYNSLNSINYFISANDRLNANQYISDFSRLMRAIMINSSQEFISLEAEIQAIRDYLELEHLRFSNKFAYEIRVEPDIDLITTEIIPSLVQPFIENAIWHGLRYLEDRRGFLSVKFIIEEGHILVCYVQDDGVGRMLSLKMKTEEQKKRRSRGIAIVEERLTLINSSYKTRHIVRVENLFKDREETGTLVRIEIPTRKPGN